MEFTYLNLFVLREFLDFNMRNRFLTAKLLKQGYRCHKLCKALSKFYRRHFELVFNIKCWIENTFTTRYIGIRV